MPNNLFSAGIPLLGEEDYRFKRGVSGAYDNYPAKNFYGPAVHTNDTHSAWDGRYFYIPFVTDKNYICRFDPLLETLDYFDTGLDLSQTLYACVVVGQYLITLAVDGYLTIVKTHIPTMTHQIFTSAYASYGIRPTVFNGDVWFPIMAATSRLVRFRLSDNSFYYITPSPVVAWVYGSCTDGVYVYFSGTHDPSKIIILDPVASTYTVYTLTAGQSDLAGICYSGHYIFGTILETNLKLMRFDPYTSSHIVADLGAVYGSAPSVIIHHGVGFAIEEASPGHLFKFNPLTLSFRMYTFFAGDGSPQSLCSDGRFVYVGFYGATTLFQRFTWLGPIA